MRQLTESEEFRINSMKIVVRELEELLEANLIIGGSWAMFFHGLGGVPGKMEVDLVINSVISNNDRRMLEGFVKANSLHPGVNKYGWLVKYQFKYKDWDIDIFTEDGIEKIMGYYPKTYFGIYLNPVGKIIAARLKMGRKKDYMSIGKLIQNILNIC